MVVCELTVFVHVIYEVFLAPELSIQLPGVDEAQRAFFGGDSLRVNHFETRCIFIEIFRNYYCNDYIIQVTSRPIRKRNTLR